MPTARKLPSGSWRCQVFSHYETVTLEDGSTKKKRIYKSFTSDDPSKEGKKLAELAATQYAADRKKASSYCSLTFREALTEYINQRTSVLSPSTVREYKRTLNSSVPGLMDIKICDITQEDIQEAINIEARTHKPKTVRNTHGIISAVLRTYRPDFALNTALPKKIRPELYIPSDSEIRVLLDQVKGTEMELPILLAAFGPMRRGEICALHSRNIHSNIVHVCENMVLSSDHKWIIRQPKTYAGDRYIEFPDFVAEKWKDKEGRIVNLNPCMVTDRFRHILEKSNLPHFRFHDLRHYSASIQHALGIPDVYIMQRGGWGNDGVLKAVYRHALEEKEKEMNNLANSHFMNIMQHEMQHGKK
ncbi:tyrosine-type recombinase/integrase [Ruminococcus sp. OA3]|uniref:site-specific integrase n=1 Tax=Ruminococcus sp. OA3 TaxID=2914164 RepID=UPI001F06DB73|nr:site-specific integrase [Ruminococcus sp. OA3]MCH1980970.1 tyrosine-type recombinase/integrase [Ruminococcus sp. OA3]MCH1984587.1 tyrosine-type recombinase/integrase [Ruminococcus sp. OA3]MCH1984602.1 tyrosine-type recombinase/integrase [Ruminococcus sp. OA3]